MQHGFPSPPSVCARSFARSVRSARTTSGFGLQAPWKIVRPRSTSQANSAPPASTAVVSSTFGWTWRVRGASVALEGGGTYEASGFGGVPGTRPPGRSPERPIRSSSRRFLLRTLDGSPRTLPSGADKAGETADYKVLRATGQPRRTPSNQGERHARGTKARGRESSTSTRTAVPATMRQTMPRSMVCRSPIIARSGTWCWSRRLRLRWN